MFKFNFSDADRNNETVLSTCETKWLDSSEIFPNNGNEIILKDILTNCEINIIDCKGSSFKYFSTTDILNILRTSDEFEQKKTFAVLNADEDHSDLQTGIYEGGLKIWECTYDLINYIVESNVSLINKRVLDLGCGAGITGILSLSKGASCTFQDYNAEVLQFITIPNISLNDEEFLSKSKFYSGDWQSFIHVFNDNNKGEKFDYIFTCETIYNTENYNKLHEVFEKMLSDDGEIYLAAKLYYFGVGGGISLFEEFLKNKKIFKYDCCWTCSQGVKRQILRISFI